MEGNKGAYHGHWPPLDAESLTSPEHLSCRLSPEPQTQALNPKPRTSNPHELGAHEQPLLSARGPIIELDLAGNLLQTAGAQVLARAVWGGGSARCNLSIFPTTCCKIRGSNPSFPAPQAPPSDLPPPPLSPLTHCKSTPRVRARFSRQKPGRACGGWTCRITSSLAAGENSM